MCPILNPFNIRENFPLLPCTWTSVRRKKDTHPPPTRLNVCTAHQLTDQLVTWLIDCYRWVSANAHKQGSYSPQHRILQFFFQLEFCPFTDSWFPRLPRTSFCCFLHVVLAWQTKSSYRKRSGLFPLSLKQSPNLGYMMPAP